MFYVYEWYNVDTNEIFYVGKGCGNRYKSISHRNQHFLNYYETHECAVRIIKYFEKEDEAFEYEHARIIELKTKNQCRCNLDDGGNGGVNFVWTKEMREYKSKYNPMKDEKQRIRMSQNNPMYNPITVEKVREKNSKIVIYNNDEYTTHELAMLKHCEISTIWKWCRRGYDTDGTPCYYKDNPINAKKKTTSSKAVLIDGQYFESLRAAANFLSVKDTSPLCKALKANKPYKGHICVYANQQPSEGNS